MKDMNIVERMMKHFPFILLLRFFAFFLGSRCSSHKNVNRYF